MFNSHACFVGRERPQIRFGDISKYKTVTPQSHRHMLYTHTRRSSQHPRSLVRVYKYSSWDPPLSHCIIGGHCIYPIFSSSFVWYNNPPPLHSYSRTTHHTTHDFPHKLIRITTYLPPIRTHFHLCQYDRCHFLTFNVVRWTSQ